MSEFDKCDRCHQWAWLPCRCELFHVLLEDDDDQNPRRVWARDPEAAARQAVEGWDKDDCDWDYPVASGKQEMRVRVEGHGAFVVSGEFQPQYYASPERATKGGGV